MPNIYKKKLPIKKSSSKCWHHNFEPRLELKAPER